MKKELLIAIIVGFCLGLVIVFGIKTANQAVKKTAPSTPSIITGPTPTSAPLQESLLTVASPEDNSISDKEKIEVTGKTAAGATILILYQEGEKIIQADNEGNFSAEITLVGGLNTIEITAYDKDENEISKTINVIYSTSPI